mgnify:CR=1 FL=1
MAVSILIIIIVLTVFFALFAAALGVAVTHGQVNMTSGKLTFSPLGRLLGWGYPILLLAALVAYYALPFDALYRGTPAPDVTASSARHQPDRGARETMDSRVQDALVGDAAAAWESSPLFDHKATLAFSGDTLELQIPTTDNMLVSQHPAADGTITLHYFPGQLNIAGYPMDEFIRPQLEDFVLDSQGQLTVAGLSAENLQVQNISVLFWQTSGIMAQFPLDTAPTARDIFFSVNNAALVVQVPAQVTVTYYGDPIDKGQVF